MAFRTFDGTVNIDDSWFEDNRSTHSHGGAIANWMHGPDVYEYEEFAEVFNTLNITGTLHGQHDAQKLRGRHLHRG